MRLFLIFICLAILAPRAHAEQAGRVTGVSEGREIDLPLLDSHYAVTIEGDLATVVVTQRFENPSDVAMEAEYLFPLNHNAAIYGMQMQVGDETVTAMIRKKAEAEATYEEARTEGKAAALLTQHRPNMFTQRIANLMPGLPVTVTLRYVQKLPKVEAQFELVLPMIVGPRYDGAPQDSADTPAQPSTWSLPAYPPVAGLSLPETLQDRVSLDLTLTAGLPLGEITSDTHPLAITRTETGATARFDQGKALDNRDLILRYTLGGDTLEAAALSHRDDTGAVLGVMVEPPRLPNALPTQPRELVFVLDTSGSMGGAPMLASKRFMRAALDGLRPQDHFRIIPFSDSAQQMSAQPLPASPEALARAHAYVAGLNAGGGTEIDTAIRTAFAATPVPGALRIVVFLSDGYIGNEAQVLRSIRRQRGDARIHAFGVGSSVNRYLLDSMAEEGRGYARYVGLGESAADVADSLARDLKTPILTDIEVDWGDLAVSDVTPARLPDLFEGTSLRLYARHNARGPATITLRGKIAGQVAEMPVTLHLSDNAEPALPLIWARSRIADMERNIAVGHRPAASEAEITRLGLAHNLQTRFTSFVAVSQQVVNSTGQATPAQVPLPMVQGVTPAAYPQGFSGSSTPEPEALLGLLLVAALGALRWLGARRGRA